MKIKLALSNYWTEGKIPTEDKETWNKFNGSFVNKEIDVTNFPKAIQKGYAYTAQCFGYRNSSNFVCTQFLAIDIDKGIDNVETLLRNDFTRQSAYFIHTTPSHTEDNPRYRIVFVLDEPVTDSKLYGEMATALTDFYKLSDSSCKDPARFFYGSKDCQVWQLDNILPLRKFYDLILKPYRIREEEKEKKRTEQLNNMIQPNQVSEKLLKIHLAKLVDHIRTASDGNKHNTILTICTTLGGYVASGYYSFNEVLERCKNEIIANPNNVKDLQHAFTTIEKALQYGMNKPLYFEDRGYGRHVDTIQPSLSDVQKRQVNIILSQAIDETKALSEAAIGAWQEKGFSKGIIDLYNFGYLKKEVNEDTGELLQDETFIVPFQDRDRKPLNIEYRFNSTYGYDNDMPFLFTTDNTKSDCPMIVLPDSLTALYTYLNIGECDYNIVGLPHMPILNETIDYDGAVVLIEPDTNILDYNLVAVRDHCRFLRLPMTMKEMLNSCLDSKLLAEYIKLGKKL